MSRIFRAFFLILFVIVSFSAEAERECKAPFDAMFSRGQVPIEIDILRLCLNWGEDSPREYELELSEAFPLEILVDKDLDESFLFEPGEHLVPIKLWAYLVNVFQLAKRNDEKVVFEVHPGFNANLGVEGEARLEKEFRQWLMRDLPTRVLFANPFSIKFSKSGIGDQTLIGVKLVPRSQGLEI